MGSSEVVPDRLSCCQISLGHGPLHPTSTIHTPRVYGMHFAASTMGCRLPCGQGRQPMLHNTQSYKLSLPPPPLLPRAFPRTIHHVPPCSQPSPPSPSSHPTPATHRVPPSCITGPPHPPPPLHPYLTPETRPLLQTLQDYPISLLPNHNYPHTHTPTAPPVSHLLPRS